MTSTHHIFEGKRFNEKISMLELEARDVLPYEEVAGKLNNLVRFLQLS
jgi:hypothetical protein